MNITNEQAIAQQLFIEHEFRPMVIPAHDSYFGNRVAEYEIDGKKYKLTLYSFRYTDPGFAKGLWLLVDRIVNGLKECQIGVRLA